MFTSGLQHGYILRLRRVLLNCGFVNYYSNKILQVYNGTIEPWRWMSAFEPASLCSHVIIYSSCISIELAHAAHRTYQTPAHGRPEGSKGRKSPSEFCKPWLYIGPILTFYIILLSQFHKLLTFCQNIVTNIFKLCTFCTHGFFQPLVSHRAMFQHLKKFAPPTKTSADAVAHATAQCNIAQICFSVKQWQVK